MLGQRRGAFGAARTRNLEIMLYGPSNFEFESDLLRVLEFIFQGEMFGVFELESVFASIFVRDSIRYIL